MEEQKPYSQFRAMMAIVAASFKSMLRSPSTIVFSIVFPLIFIFAFGFISNGIFAIEVATAPGIDRNNNIYYQLQAAPLIKLAPGVIYDDLEESLKNGKTDAILDIQPDTTGENEYLVVLKTSTADPGKAEILELIVRETVATQNLGSIEQTKALPVAIRQEKVEGRLFKMIDFILPGQLGFSLLSTGVFGTSFVFFNFRQTLVIKRFFATPVRKLYIILGEALSRMIFGLLGALALILIGYYFFEFTLYNGFESLLYLLLLSGLGLIIFMGFGFIISGLANNSSTIPPLANIVTLPQFILSGTFFSIDMLPDWLTIVSYALPLTYLNEAMRMVAFEGASFIELYPHLLILLAWGAALYLIAARTFKWE